MAVQSFLLRAALPLCVVGSLALQTPLPVHLVIVSVDGLMPSAYTGPDSARLPTLQTLARDNQLAVFPHEDFWMGMDTFREYTELNSLWAKGEAPWRVWDKD